MIIIRKGSHVEAWTTLTKLCRAYPEFKYWYIHPWKFPFTYKGWVFEKHPVNIRREAEPKNKNIIKGWGEK